MEMARISATSDIVFKYLFGAQSSTELLKNFVNAVQRHAGLPEFRSLEIINPIGEREYLSAKPTVIDIKARAADGTVVNVEVQVRTQAEFGERSLYYWAQSYTEQVLAGQDYWRLKPVVSVSLLNFSLFPDNIPFRSTFQLREQDQPDVVLTTDCVLHYLELPKILGAEPDELLDWLFALKHLDEKEGPMMTLLERNHSIQLLADRFHRFEEDPTARMAYLDRMKFLNDQASLVAQANREGLEAGRKEGREEGREEGIEIGVAKGKRTMALEMARELLAEGLPRERVASLTKLTEDDLKEAGQ